MSLAAGGTNQNITLTPSGTGSVAFSRLVAASATAPSALAAGSGAIYFQANGSVAGTQDSWVFDTGYTDQTYRFKVAGTDRVVIAANTGNFLVGTTTDGGQKLQVNGNSGFLGHIEIPADKHIYLKDGNPARWSSTGLSSGTLIADIYANSNSLYFRTNGATLALTLDSSQRCILAGALRLNNAYVSGAPTATGYVTLQDSAGNTYKVLVGT
jgi:hypothetical protein